mgnify:CR=1 FL=1
MSLHRTFTKRIKSTEQKSYICYPIENMKKLSSILLILGTALFVSCTKEKIPEGEIHYAISYPHNELKGMVEHIMPEEMTLTFKGTKIRSQIARGKIFQTEVVSNESDQSIEMRLDFGDKMFYCILDKDDVATLKESQPKYMLNATGTEDSVAGCWGKEYTIKREGDIKLDNAWFTEDLVPQEAYFYSSYAGIVGVPLVFDIERYGIIMHLEATGFTRREVKDEEFTRSSELSEISFDQYEKEVQELFDILMN